MILLIAVAACRPAQVPVGIETPQPSAAATQPEEPLPAINPIETDAAPEITIEPTAVSSQPSERTFYDLDVTFDYYAYRLDVRQRIEYSNPVPTPLSELVLMVEPNRYHRTFELQRLAVSGEPVSDYSLEKNVLTVPLSAELEPGARTLIEIDYRLELPQIREPSGDQRPELFGYTERQVNLVDWYPMVAAYNPEQGWLAYPAWYYGEHQVYEPAGYRVVLRFEPEVPFLTIAASSKPSFEDGVYLFEMDVARNFVFSASVLYLTASEQVGDTVVTSYFFPFDEVGGRDALKYTVEALQTYTLLFGPYPHDTLSVVEADFLDGMEFEGLFFLSKGFYSIYDGQPGSYLGAIAVHETAHQWWYGQVGNDQAREPWLDEALCTYSEYVFYEANYPDAIPWWQQVRVDYYEPQGKIDLAINEYNGYVPYRNAVYLRGALFLHELRQVVGDRAFFGALQSLVDEFRYDRLVSTEDFFTAFEEQTSVDYQDLIGEYFTNR